METALVKTPICPLMSAPTLQCERADEALLGWTLQILDAPAPGWYEVRTHYGYPGFAPADCLTAPCGDWAGRLTAPCGDWAGRAKAVVIRGLCDVLSAPAVESWRLETLTRGALVVPVGPPDERGFLKIALPDGREGYTKRHFLKAYSGKPAFSSAQALRETITAYGKSYLGTHYRWGGKTPVGIDCSGLAFMSYFLCGVTIFRDARIEPGFPVRPIALKDAGPGDLLYFPGHVALCLGGGRYLHATARDGSDGVVINSLIPSAPDYRADLAKGITAVGSIF